MWFWILLGTVFVGLLSYIYFTLATTSGSSYQNNSIDAFIRQGNNGDKEETIDAGYDCKYTKVYTEPGRQILVIYGTEYGFSEEVSKHVFDRLSEVKHTSDDKYLQPRLVNAKHHQIIDWSSEQICLVVIATSGDGVPPSDAEEFYNAILSSTDQYNHLKYSVLAIGDSNYPQFCKTGRTLNESFRSQSAECLVPCHDVDMEDWSVIHSWLDKVIDYLKAADIEIRQDYLDLSGLDEEGGYDRHNPFMAKLKVKKLLTHSSSTDDKETIHCEFDISDSGLMWISGDALGIYPHNNPTHVTDILRCLGVSGTEIVPTPTSAYKPCQATDSLKAVLMKYYDLKHVKPELLCLLVKSTEPGIKNRLLKLLDKGLSKSNTDLHDYLAGCEVVDVLEECIPVTMTTKEFLSCLKSLQPRYYSISSSPKIDDNIVCVTAAVVQYSLRDKPREGVTTTFLHHRLPIDDTVPVFISRNPDFRLPGNQNLPVILIGPGTGIAPFRAFIQERELYNIKGKTHLYFGCRHKHKDYLYREELETYEKNGTICLNVAFSRDQTQKVYVQDLLCRDSNKIWTLINEERAHIYVCGDAKHMAHDIHKILLYIAQTEGNMEESGAFEYFRNLEQNSRYQKDVWIS